MKSIQIAGLLSFFVITPALAAPAAPAVLTASSLLVDRIEASVNSSLILHSDLAHFRKTERLRSQLDPLYSNTALATKGALAPDSEIVDFLCDEKLILELFPVTDSEVEQEINTIQTNNKIDRSTLKSAIEQQGFSFDDYFELIRASTSKRNLIERDIRTKVSITDNDVKNYYYNKLAQNKDAHRAYNLHIIYISPKSYKTALALKEAVQRAQNALRSGEEFEEVAKRMSDDASAPNGGDMGTLTDDQMSPVVREQVKTLQIGQVSDVFGTVAQGFYFVKLIDVKSDETARLDRMKDEIRNQLFAAEYQHQIQLWLERQRQTAFIHRAAPILQSQAN